MSYLGLTFNKDHQYLDIDFEPTQGTEALYQLLSELYTFSDVDFTDQVISNRLASVNFYGNAISSSQFTESIIGSSFLSSLSSRLRGFEQMSSIRESLTNIILKYSDRLTLLELKVMPTYKVGKLEIYVRLYDIIEQVPLEVVL